MHLLQALLVLVASVLSFALSVPSILALGAVVAPRRAR
jgi:hypothetical protein